MALWLSGSLALWSSGPLAPPSPAWCPARLSGRPKAEALSSSPPARRCEARLDAHDDFARCVGWLGAPQPGGAAALLSGGWDKRLMRHTLQP